MTKVKGKWNRDKQPRPKFLVACASIQEWREAHIVAAAMGLPISKMIRQLIADQHANLIAGGNYVTSIPEVTLNLKLEGDNHD